MRSRIAIDLFAILAIPSLSFAATITVTSISDAQQGGDGICTLPEAIIAANTDTASGGQQGECVAGSGTDVIEFQIPGPGEQVILPLAPLPTISEPLTINGYSQPDSSPNMLDAGSNASILITIDGLLLTVSTLDRIGLEIDSPAVVIKGLRLLGFSRGILLKPGSSQSRVVGCHIRYNTIGIELLGDLSDIGDGQNAERNLISENHIGVVVRGSLNEVDNNLIGTDAPGQTAADNSSGVRIPGNANVVHRNVISGNGFGIIIRGKNNSISANIIGLNAQGTSSLGNLVNGIEISGSFNFVGNSTGGGENIIAYNGEGIEFRIDAFGNFPNNNEIRGNSIFRNRGLGISRGFSGPLENDDAPDLDDWQNHPILVAAEANTSTQIDGFLESKTETTYRIQFYANSERDLTGHEAGEVHESGHGEGEQFLGSVMVTTDNDGFAPIQATFPNPNKPWITATATSPEGETSNFSPTIPLVGDTYTVNSTATTIDGSCDELGQGGGNQDCTLPEAANAVNSSAGDGISIIEWAIPGQGPHVITLPPSGESFTVPVIIDGCTQEGATEEDPKVSLNAENSFQPVLSFLNNSTVRCLRINGDPGVGFIGDGNRVSNVIFGEAPVSRMGVWIQGGSDRNIVGGLRQEDEVLIQNSPGAGTFLDGAFNYFGKVIFENNFVGIDGFGPGSHDNIIYGGTFSNNSTSGVVFAGSGVPFTYPLRNRITASTFGDNGGLGIDHEGDGVNNPNDSGDGDSGPNDGQNNPENTQAQSYQGGLRVEADGGVSMGFTAVSGSLDSTPNTVFTLEFFSNTNCDPSGFGEGEMFLGSDEIETDDTGVVMFTSPLAISVPTGSFVTATATDPGGNTSEFSACVEVVEGPPAPDIDVSPLAIDFGEVLEGDMSQSTVTVTNQGPGDLEVFTLEEGLFLEFSVDQDTCTGAVLMMGEQCTFDVVFTPNFGGTVSDDLVIESNDPDESSTSIALLGTGLGAGSILFSDGFESGDTSAWSGSQ